MKYFSIISSFEVKWFSAIKFLSYDLIPVGQFWEPLGDIYGNIYLQACRFALNHTITWSNIPWLPEYRAQENSSLLCFWNHQGLFGIWNKDLFCKLFSGNVLSIFNLEKHKITVRLARWHISHICQQHRFSFLSL